MAFPIRDNKKIIEANSLRVLRNTLPEEWIYRHEASDDYGIDVQIEMVTKKCELEGDLFKGQVKGETDIKFAKDERAGVGGIKQTTLAYWIGLSRYLNVIGFLVDIPGNKVYWTPLFWEATTLLDGTETTKSIHFSKHDLADVHSFGNVVIRAAGPTPFQQIRAHRRMLRMMPEYMLLFVQAMDYDAWTTADNDSIFRSFIEDCRVLCHLEAAVKGAAPFTPQHWYIRSEEKFGDYLMYGTIREAMTLLLPDLLRVLREFQRWVSNSGYYWENSDRHYLETVLAIPIPENLDAIKPAEWGDEIARIQADSGHFI